jgi:hypothetical protein
MVLLFDSNVSVSASLISFLDYSGIWTDTVLVDTYWCFVVMFVVELVVQLGHLLDLLACFHSL